MHRVHRHRRRVIWFLRDPYRPVAVVSSSPGRLQHRRRQCVCAHLGRAAGVFRPDLLCAHVRVCGTARTLSIFARLAPDRVSLRRARRVFLNLHRLHPVRRHPCIWHLLSAIRRIDAAAWHHRTLTLQIVAPVRGQRLTALEMPAAIVGARGGPARCPYMTAALSAAQEDIGREVNFSDNPQHRV